MTSPGDGPQLLVVDDNRDAADSLALLLRLWGYRPQVAYEGRTALRLADTLAVDGVIADLGMPGLDGFQLATELRARPDWISVPLIAMTGYSDASHRTQARVAGYDHFLVKPIEPEGLQRLLGELLRVRLLTVRLDALARRHADLARQGAELTEQVREQATLLRQKLRDHGE